MNIAMMHGGHVGRQEDHLITLGHLIDRKVIDQVATRATDTTARECSLLMSIAVVSSVVLAVAPYDETSSYQQFMWQVQC